MVLLSSTVITPSLPTLSMASAMSSPTSASCAETVATPAMAERSSTGMATLSSAPWTASTAARMPRPSAMGLAPAATLRSPSCTSACASTVAVVVPSPATSLVLVATFLASWAPRFSYGSSSSTSRAMVTPSLVMVGGPNFLSRTTLRPRGPRVTLTVSASLSTPRSSERRASSLNLMILAMPALPRRDQGWDADRPGTRGIGPPGRSGCSVRRVLLLHHGEQVARRQDEVLLAAVLDLGAAVLGVDDDVADLHVQRDAVAVVVDAPGAHGDDRALLRLLLGRVGDDQAGGGGGLGLVGLDHDPVLQRLDADLGSGRHDVTPPSGSDGCGCADAVAREPGPAVAGVRRHCPCRLALYPRECQPLNRVPSPAADGVARSCPGARSAACPALGGRRGGAAAAPL